MAFLYLLDTNIISELSKPIIDKNMLTNFSRKQYLSAISAITLQELLLGHALLPDGKRKDQLTHFIDLIVRNFEFIPYERNAASCYAEIASQCQKGGNVRPVCDTQIAATALANNMILATRNLKDFLPMQKVCQLKVENWFV